MIKGREVYGVIRGRVGEELMIGITFLEDMLKFV